jgi:hypothetical protein
MPKNVEKFTAGNFVIFFDQKLEFIYPSVLKREHPALQNMKKFFTFFYFLE